MLRYQKYIAATFKIRRHTQMAENKISSNLLSVIKQFSASAC